MSKRYWLAKSDPDTKNNIARGIATTTSQLIKRGRYTLGCSGPCPNGTFAEYKQTAKDEHKGNARGTRVLEAVWHMRFSVKPGDRIIMIERGKVVAKGTVAGKEPYECQELGKGRGGYFWRSHHLSVDWTPFESIKGVSAAKSPLNKRAYQSTPFIEISDNPQLLGAVGETGVHSRAIVDIANSNHENNSGATKAMEGDPDWMEGGKSMRNHLVIERCSAAAKKAKEQARKKGHIRCQCCNHAPSMNFGHEIIDAHHITPLKDLGGKMEKVTIGQFALLCPTCHRAVHKLINKEGLDGKAALMVASSRARKS